MLSVHWVGTAQHQMCTRDHQPNQICAFMTPKRFSEFTTTTTTTMQSVSEGQVNTMEAEAGACMVWHWRSVYPLTSSRHPCSSEAL